MEPTIQEHSTDERVERLSEMTGLYHQAFDRFGAMALWNVRRFSNPSPADVLVITRSLRKEGNLDARRLAEQIEAACRAAL